MSYEHPTISLPKGMGFREFGIAAKILGQLAESGYPDDFDGVYSKVGIGFNPKSGCVYLYNEDGDCACLNEDGILETWFYLGGTGIEGFFNDLRKKYHNEEITDECDLEDYKNICEMKGVLP